VTSRHVVAQHLRDLACLRRVARPDRSGVIGAMRGVRNVLGLIQDR
jgi:hypothetical protein